MIGLLAALYLMYHHIVILGLPLDWMDLFNTVLNHEDLILLLLVL